MLVVTGNRKSLVCVSVGVVVTCVVRHYKLVDPGTVGDRDPSVDIDVGVVVTCFGDRIFLEVGTVGRFNTCDGTICVGESPVEKNLVDVDSESFLFDVDVGIGVVGGGTIRSTDLV